MLELVNSTIQDVAKKHGVTYDPCGRFPYPLRQERSRLSQIEVLRILGLDEISLLKGHRDFVTIVSTQDKNGTPVLLAVLKGREKSLVVEFLKTIPERLREGVEEACPIL
ncbi:MAG: transposase [Blastocatellales bacterium]|nr:transposase [Blastocatellales bacterium]